MNGTSNSANDKNELFHIQKDSTYLKEIYPRDGWGLLSITNLIE